VIAPVGVSQSDFDSGEIRGDVYLRPLATNAQSICGSMTMVLSRFFAVKHHASSLALFSFHHTLSS
jgi:hypothetical protein